MEITIGTSYAATVDTLPDAWAFVMKYVDRCGPAPVITIKPYWLHDIETPKSESQPKFEVCVNGTVEAEDNG